jgi:hypothetical protein
VPENLTVVLSVWCPNPSGNHCPQASTSHLQAASTSVFRRRSTARWVQRERLWWREKLRGPATASNRRFPNWANFDSFMGLMISHTLGCTGMYMDLYPQAKNKKNVFFPFFPLPFWGSRIAFLVSSLCFFLLGFSRHTGPTSCFSWNGWAMLGFCGKDGPFH